MRMVQDTMHKIMPGEMVLVGQDRILEKNLVAGTLCRAVGGVSSTGEGVEPVVEMVILAEREVVDSMRTWEGALVPKGLCTLECKRRVLEENDVNWIRNLSRRKVLMGSPFRV